MRMTTVVNVATGETTLVEDNSPPPEEGPAPAPPVLTPAQWRFFLNITGFGAAIDATLSAMPKTTMQERAAWAALEAVAYGSPDYSLPATIALAEQFGGASKPSQAEIEAAWAMAAQFHGAASIMGAGNG